MAGDDRQAARRVDQVCDAFEAQWRRGESPSLRNCLEQIEEASRAEAFGQLLGIELFWRKKHGARPSPEDYQRSFREFVPFIEREFREADLQSNTDNTMGPPSSKEPHQRDSPLHGGKPARLGNYLLLDKIGAGGMGQVYKARHERMKRIVALKVLSPELVASQQAIQRFQREVEAAARLAHPNIVTAYDAGEEEGISFLVMEYVEGRDLGSQVRGHGPLDLATVLDCVLQAARGLQYAHQQGIIHRDIKPENLLRDGAGTVKILDMGLARLSSSREERHAAAEPALTEVGQVMGTYDYMAPEQAEDTRQADARADIYALGCTLYFLLTGQPVFKATSLGGKIVAHRERPVPSLCEVRPDVPPRLDEIFQRMVAKNPQDRYAAMSDVSVDLRPLCGDEAGAATTSAASADTDLSSFLETISPTPTDVGAGTTHTVNRTEPLSAASRVESHSHEDRVQRYLVIIGAVSTILLAISVYFWASYQRQGSDGSGASEPPPPQGVPADAGEDERKAALWALARQGSLHVVSDGVAQDVNSGAALPEGTVHILDMNLSQAEDLHSLELQQLKSLSHLQSLQLPAQITDEGLTHLPAIATLRWLSLRNCRVSAHGLDHVVAAFPNLTHLDLGYTLVGDEGLKRLQKLRLTSLTLLHQQITDDGLRALASHPLDTVYIEMIPISDAGLKHVASLPRLSQLSVAHTNITGDGLAHLSQLESLTLLNLSGNGIDDRSLRHLQGLDNLRSLSLSSTGVTDDGLQQLVKLDRVFSLALNHLSVSDRGLAQLAKMTRLAFLHLEDTQVTDAGLPQLATLTSLEELTLHGAAVSEEGAANLRQLLPRCRIEH